MKKSAFLPALLALAFVLSSALAQENGAETNSAPATRITRLEQALQAPSLRRSAIVDSNPEYFEGADDILAYIQSPNQVWETERMRYTLLETYLETYFLLRHLSI